MNRFITFPSYGSDCLDFKCAVAQNDAFYLYFCHSFCSVSDSYFILREYNGEFLPWSHVTMARILHLKYSSFNYKLFVTMQFLTR